MPRESQQEDSPAQWTLAPAHTHHLQPGQGIHTSTHAQSQGRQRQTAALPVTNNGPGQVSGRCRFPPAVPCTDPVRPGDAEGATEKAGNNFISASPSLQGQHWGRVPVATGATHREGLVGASIQVGGTARAEGVGGGGMQVSA